MSVSSWISRYWLIACSNSYFISVDNGITMKVWSCCNKDHDVYSTLQEYHSNNGYVIGIIIFLLVQKPAIFHTTGLTVCISVCDNFIFCFVEADNNCLRKITMYAKWEPVEHFLALCGTVVTIQHKAFRQ